MGPPPEDSFLELVEKASALHAPARAALVALSNLLGTLAEQADSLVEAHEQAGRDHARASRALEEVADEISTLLAETALAERPERQPELLAAIMQLKLRLEGARADRTLVIQRTAEELLALPAGVPVLYLDNDVWRGCRTADASYLSWDGSDWWLEVVPGLEATHIELDSLGDPEDSPIRRTIFVGQDDIAAFVHRLADDGVNTDRVMQAVREAGLTPGTIQHP